MSGTKVGGIKARDKNYKHHGKDFYKNIGAKGGRAGRGPGYNGGFAANHERAVAAGRKGGRLSRRGCTLIGKTSTHLLYENSDGDIIKVARDGKEE